MTALLSVVILVTLGMTSMFDEVRGGVKKVVNFPCKLSPSQKIHFRWHVRNNREQLKMELKRDNTDDVIFHLNVRYDHKFTNGSYGHQVSRSRFRSNNWESDGNEHTFDPSLAGLGDGSNEMLHVELTVTSTLVDIMVGTNTIPAFTFMSGDTASDVRKMEFWADVGGSSVEELKMTPGLTSFTKSRDTSFSSPQPLVTSLQRSWTHCLLDCCNSAVLGCSAATYNNLNHQCHLYNLDENPMKSAAPGWTSYSRGGVRVEVIDLP